ncbi:hypothetical protein ABZ567_28450 [Streptomyces sp. NPDC016459]|uniref:hypothetical protein n=1 Tax=Streptomyces sp. NPDC016459 TaxID=3157190 RepID=UPI0033E129B5
MGHVQLYPHPPGLIRIEITAEDRRTAEVAAARISELWLSSSAPTRPAPGQNFRAVVHADLDCSPHEMSAEDEATGS